MSKLTNTLNDHAHVRIRTCIENYQSESGCVPRQQATMRYQERGLVHGNEYKICHSYHHSIKFHFQIKHPIMLAPHQNPFYFEWINFANSITWNYENKFTLILKHFKNHRQCKNGLPKRKIATNFIERNGIFEMKNCGKPKLFWKSEFGKSFTTWDWENYFKNERMRKWGMTHDPKVAMQTMQIGNMQERCVHDAQRIIDLVTYGTSCSNAPRTVILFLILWVPNILYPDFPPALLESPWSK